MQPSRSSTRVLVVSIREEMYDQKTSDPLSSSPILEDVFNGEHISHFLFADDIASLKQAEAVQHTVQTNPINLSAWTWIWKKGSIVPKPV